MPGLSSRPLPLWIAALTAADTDLRREVVDTIVLAPLEYACGWAIHSITGEPMPVFVPIRLTRGQWFLEPLEGQGM